MKEQRTAPPSLTNHSLPHTSLFLIIMILESSSLGVGIGIWYWYWKEKLIEIDTMIDEREQDSY